MFISQIYILLIISFKRENRSPKTLPFEVERGNIRGIREVLRE
jgi:hypothetical protein